MARKAKKKPTNSKKETVTAVSFFSKYAFVIRDWTKRRSISGGIYKKMAILAKW